MHLSVSRSFDRLGVFDQNNVLFDADANTKLEALSEGRHLGIKHPNLMAYFTPPITLTAKAIVALSPGDDSEKAMRRRLGTWVAPVASGLTTALIFVLFGALGFSLLQSIVATLLASVSFSTFVFGSIPESYALTALVLAMVYVFAAGAGRDHRRTWVVASWIAIGVAATGITVINIVFVGLLMGGAVWNDTSRTRALVRVAVIAIAIFGLTGSSAWVFDAMRPAPESKPNEPASSTLVDRAIGPVRTEITNYAAPDPIRQLLHFPTTLANTFAPPVLERQPIKLPARYPLGFTLKNSPSVFGLGDPFGASVLLLIVAGTVCWFMNRSTRGLAVASTGIIVFSGLLGVWGLETFLYSQNWNLAAVVLMTGVMRYGPAARAMTVVIAVVTLVVGCKSFLVIRAIIDVLAASST